MLCAGILGNGVKPVSDMELLKHVATRLTGQEITILCKRNGMFLFPATDHAQPLHDQYGIVFGNLYNKQPMQKFNKQTLECLSRNEHEFLSEQCFGRYLVITYRDMADCTITVVPEPTGQIRFFYHTTPEGYIIFSTQLQILQEYLLAKGVELTCNWGYMQQFLLNNPIHHLTETGFTEIKTIPIGAKLSMNSNSVSTALLWKPEKFYTKQKLCNNKINRLKTFTSLMKNFLKNVIHEYEDIYVNLHHDIYSVILLKCLYSVLEKHQHLVAVTYLQEPENIQATCKELGINLLHIPKAKIQDIEALQSLHPNQPNMHIVPALQHAHVLKFSNSLMRSILITDYAVESLFSLHNTQLSMLKDYYHEHGVFKVLEKIPAIAASMHTSYWHIMKELFFRRNSAKQLPAWIKIHETTPLSAEVMNALHHLPGKFQHIQQTLHAVASMPIYQFGTATIDCIHPYMTQPLLELFFSIPTYELLEFSKELQDFFLKDCPKAQVCTSDVITDRTAVGTWLMQNLLYIQDLCLSGNCAKYGVVDTEKLTKVLDSKDTDFTANSDSICAILALEKFMQCYIQCK
jgi:hypothetical protein